MPDPKKSPRTALVDIRRGEWPLALQMFGYFFLIITTFWILKPIKKSIFVRYYDVGGLDLWGWQLDAAQAELIAKVGNMFVAAVAVAVFSFLSQHLRREKLALAFCGFFAVTLVGYTFAIEQPNDFIVWSFYLYGDLYSTLMVATFFAFLNDSVTPSAAKRLYPLIVLGGVAGGAFGSSSLRAWIDAVGHSQWLWICAGATVVVALLAAGAGWLVRKGAVVGVESEPEEAAATATEPAEKRGNIALEGARLAFRSPYLLSIAAIIGLYEIVSTVMDFQFTSTVAHYLDGADIERHFATVFTITNGASLVVQLFVTSYVMNHFRLSVALMVTPVIILSASVGFLIVPILWLGSLLNTADNAFNYSINQSARETLYTPLTRDEKYKGKAFIDMFVQRFAKALAVGVSLVVTTVFADFSSVRWLSLVVVVCVAMWLVAARYAGRRFRALGREDEAER